LNLTRTLLDSVGRIYQNSLFLTNLFDFLALEPKVVTPPAPAKVPSQRPCSIELRGVSFCYPGSSRAALNNFNLEVPAGSVTAVVGPNGAGKSTLIKLLCRFYDPDQGQVYLDGIDIRTLSVDDLRASITVLFQQPLHFNATASQNIALGKVAALREEIEDVAKAAAADGIIRQLPGGYDQLLGKWFEDGAELSVGEWQRIALARAFLRNAPLILLDEPTSAMDPWAEADWLARFRELARGRTAILITHRFTTARLADCIHVMADGGICESGSHEDLIAHDGLYAQWWNAQRTV
jgi:ATP-binding cassette subfamily B protein